MMILGNKCAMGCRLGGAGILLGMRQHFLLPHYAGGNGRALTNGSNVAK